MSGDPRPIVAETLRTVAGWLSDDVERDMVYSAMRAVEAMQPGDTCCALCEEVECDEGCPFEHWRAICDHPGMEHGTFAYIGRCPGCGKCKFIGHGPLCWDCYTSRVPSTSEGEGA
jgi:hypothetical protein